MVTSACSSPLLWNWGLYNVSELKGKIVWKSPKQIALVTPFTMGRLWSCLDINIWIMPSILYHLKPVALFPSVLKMMNIILHIPLLISHVFMYQASGYVFIYITAYWTKKKTSTTSKEIKTLLGRNTVLGGNTVFHFMVKVMSSWSWHGGGMEVVQRTAQTSC